MNQLLKNELDFQGFVVSDWSAVFNTTLGKYNPSLLVRLAEQTETGI